MCNSNNMIYMHFINCNIICNKKIRNNLSIHRGLVELTMIHSQSEVHATIRIKKRRKSCLSLQKEIQEGWKD